MVGVKGGVGDSDVSWCCVVGCGGGGEVVWWRVFDGWTEGRNSCWRETEAGAVGVWICEPDDYVGGAGWDADDDSSACYLGE